MSLKAGNTKVSLHLFLNNPAGVLEAEVHENLEERLRSRQTFHQTPLPGIGETKTPCEKLTDSRSESRLNQAFGFCWSLSMTPDSKIAEKKLASLELNQRLKNLPCLSDVSSTVETPGLQQAKTSNNNVYTDEQFENGQRKVSEKLAEWLDEYNLVTQRQHVYLRKIHDLRQGLLHHEDKKSLLRGVDRTHQNPNHRRVSRRYPVYTLTKMEDKAVHHGPEAFPNRPCLLYDRSKSPKIHMAPSVGPRKLAPIVKHVGTDKSSTEDVEIKEVEENNKPSKVLNGGNNNVDKVNTSREIKKEIQDFRRPEMNTMRTEYEPFESIARRNNLNISQLLNTSINNRMINRRLPVQMSRVTVIDEMSNDDYSVTPTYWNQLTVNNNRKFTTTPRMKQASPTTNKQVLPAINREEIIKTHNSMKQNILTH